MTPTREQPLGQVRQLGQLLDAVAQLEHGGGLVRQLAVFGRRLRAAQELLHGERRRLRELAAGGQGHIAVVDGGGVWMQDADAIGEIRIDLQISEINIMCLNLFHP